VLAVNLPAGAATWRSCGYDAGWTDEAHLAAFLADAVQVGNWQRGGGQGPAPKPLPRPGDESRANTKKAAIEAKAQAFLARQSATPRQGDAPDGFTKEEGS
jgi:hypothetical protein